MGDLSLNFDRKEFACKCDCGFDSVSLDLVTQLQRLRSFLRLPIQINSGCRCPAYNAQVGGKPDSAHLSGRAADIGCVDSRTRYHMLRFINTWSLFNRVGIGSNFLHVDVDAGLPQDVIWLYGKGD